MNKSELVNYLHEEHQQWTAFLDGIDPARMDQPGVAAHWSVKDIVAHLTGWNRNLAARIQAAQRSEPQPPPPWPAHLEAEDDINAWIYEASRSRSVQAVLDESHQQFRQFLAVIKGLPDEVQIETQHHQGRAYHVVQLGDQRFLTGEFFDHFHDDHEADVRAWLARAE
jgi:hypothetical protein